MSSLFSLPSELWMEIARMVDEVDEATALDDGCGTDSDSEEEVGMITSSPVKLREMEELGEEMEELEEEMEAGKMIRKDGSNFSAMACLSVVSREFSILAFPFLWTHIDFEGRTNEEATYFLEVIMPRHAVHVKSIWFRTTIAENDIYDDYLIQEEGEDEFMRGEEANDAVPSQSHAETARLQAVEAAATQKHKWNEKERRKIFASIIEGLPSLVSIDFDLFKPSGSAAKALLVAKALIKDESRASAITELAICSPDTHLLDADFLATYIRHFPNLKALNLEDVDAGSESSLILPTLAGLESLEALTLANTLFLGPNSLEDIEFKGSLKCLQLDTCSNLTLPTFITLIESLGKSLEILNIEETPSEIISDADLLKFLPDGTRFKLPHLSVLVISTMYHIQLLQAFSLCPIEAIELGFNPFITYEEIFEFLGSLVPKLKSVKITEESNLTDGNRESLEVWCLTKGIDCEVEEPMSDGSEEEDDEGAFSADEDGSGNEWDEEMTIENDSDSD